MSQKDPKIDFNQARERFAREASFRTVDTGRYQARAWSWGQGPDLLFIHGMSDRSDSFVLVASELCKDFRCIGYDLPGIQPGDKARLFSYRHDHLVGDARKILDAFGSSAATVVGASFGSTIAQKLLATDSQRFVAGILQGGFAHRPIGWKNFLLAWAGRFASPRPLIRFQGYSGILKKVHGHGFEIREPEVWDWFLKCVGDTPLPTMAHQALMISKLDQRRLLPSILQPVLLITGELDQTIDSRATEPLLQALPKVEHQSIPNCGHVPCYTHPEKIVDLIRSWSALKNRANPLSGALGSGPP